VIIPFITLPRNNKEVTVILNAKRKTLGHARDIMFQLQALEFKPHNVFIFNVQQ
jgi:hypothetical protein